MTAPAASAAAIAISPLYWWPLPGSCSSATMTPATPLTDPIERSISPSSRTNTTPIATAETPAICTIRLRGCPR